MEFLQNEAAPRDSRTMDTNVEIQVWEVDYVSIFFLFHSPFYVYSCVKLLVFISSCFGNSELNVFNK